MLARCGELTSCVCSQLYYPVEHIAWAADQQLVGVASTHVWTVAIILWAIPLLITIVRKLRELMSVCRQSQSGIRTAAETQLRGLMLDMVQNLCDLILAVFWMPPGFLWGGKLSATWWGLFGTISSLIGLYKTIVCQ